MGIRGGVDAQSQSQGGYREEGEGKTAISGEVPECRAREEDARWAEKGGGGGIVAKEEERDGQ